MRSIFPDVLSAPGTPRDPEFPPALNGIAVDAAVSPLKHACEGAADGSCGAGDVLWSRRADAASAAVVLEPEVPLVRALQMVPVMAVAAVEALGVIGPPHLGLGLRWPGRVLVNGAEAGRVFAAVADPVGEEAAPDWLVVGFSLALAWPVSVADPGTMEGRTVLYEEGCGELDRTEVIEAVSRHFLSAVDGWEQEGFGVAHRAWMAKAADMNDTMTIEINENALEGTMIGLDEDGGLLLRRGGETRLVTLAEAIEAGLLRDE